MEFHIQYTKPYPALVHWPKGFWALYQITGDQIADRQVKVDGVVTERHSWCGYIGGYGSLAEVTAEIERLTK